jgi:DNA-binding transcriptional regulator YiaG
MSVTAFSGSTGTMFVLAPQSFLDVSTAWTSTNEPAVLEATATTAEAVRQLRKVSGLTWDELARLFGVSRRAVHNWAAGGALNARNAQLLGTLVGHINQLDRGSAEATRAALMAPSRDGRSRYDEVAALSRRDVVRAPEGARPGQLVGARHDDRDVTGALVEFERHDGGGAGA